MSRFASPKSRSRMQAGFSVVAALVSVVILTAVALALQATIPVEITPESQSAAINTAAVYNVKVGTQNNLGGLQFKSAPTADTLKSNCVPGYDYKVLENKGGVPVVEPFKVCPEGTTSLPPKPFQNSNWGNGAHEQQCVLDTTKRTWKPNPNPPWSCAVIWCSPPGQSVNGAVTAVKPVDQETAKQMKLDGVQCWDVASIADKGSIDPADIRGQGLAEVLPGLTQDQQKQFVNVLTPLDATNQTILNDAYERTLEDNKTFVETKLADNQKAIERIADCEGASACTTNEKQALADLRDQQKKLASDKANLEKELQALQDNKVVLSPDDTNKTNTGPRVTTGPLARPDDSNKSTDIGNNRQFTNPNLNANNAPPSPFGGPCTNGYICMGNTLYYQTSNQYGTYNNGSASCMTQPVQQCQYGCQQASGAGQQNSTLGGIMQGVQIFSALSSLFGGGNSNGITNPNQSRSCATQPQQQQNPFGTGTNGQACAQPPQQPDPAQCTSGTWKPISGSGNGCTTGYQCVPNGSNSGAPTAQLSCQPKIVDVGAPISFSFSCGNASGSTGTGFDTKGEVSGNATTSAPNPPAGQNTATYTLTCINLGVTASAQCQAQIGKPGIVLVTNPKQVRSGETALIGWITAGMQSCKVSGVEQVDFTQRNANNTSVNGAATTSPITSTAHFQLDCTTLGGDTRTAMTEVTVQ